MHVMLRGCCLEELKQIPDGLVDMVFADLPYGVTCNKWDSVIPFALLWDQLLRVGKKNAAFVFTATQPFATALINSQPKFFRYDLVWEKSAVSGFLNCRCRPLPSHESILIFSQGTANPQSLNRIVYNPQKTKGTPYRTNPGIAGGNTYNHSRSVKKTKIDNKGDRYPVSVLKIATIRGNHPTQKPVALLEWLIKTYSNPGDVILDPTMGSGTTGVACANTQRHFIGVEKDPTYFDTAQKRVDSAYAQAVENGLFDNEGAIVLEELKARIKQFEKSPEPSEKQKVLKMLKGVVTKRALSAMSLQAVTETLIAVMEVPEVLALGESGETITLAELTRKERRPKTAAARAEPEEDDDEGDSGDEDEDEDEE
jgi:site-specific DNA-methyltransferase (adenine-specific)